MRKAVDILQARFDVLCGTKSKMKYIQLFSIPYLIKARESLNKRQS